MSSPKFIRGLVLSSFALTLLWPAAFAQAPKAPELAVPDSETPTVKGPPNQPAIPVQRTKGMAGTLLFTQGATGGQGGQFTRVGVSALPGTAAVPADLSYDRFYGPLTMKSLDQVMRATVAMQHGWPQGQKLQITFTDRPTPSELNPATLAAALALDSMLRNYDIDPTYAAIGWLQEDGSVEAVGGIPERLGGAGRARVARIAVPEKNYEQVSDYLLSQGFGAFVGTQIFSVTNFNEAGVLALTKLDPKTQEVINLFTSVQKTLQFSQGNATILRTEATQNLLRKVLAAAPNHCSAQILLDWGTGKKATISFDGSVDFIDRHAALLIKGMRAKPQEALQIPRDQVVQQLAMLRFVGERLDPQAKGYAGGIARFGDTLQKSQGPGKTQPKLAGPALVAFTAAQQAAMDEWTKMVAVRREIAEKKMSEKAKEKEEAK